MNSQSNNNLDEQRLLYMYQCFNTLMKLLNNHLDNQNSPKLDNSSIEQKAYLEFKRGNISKEQYERIMDALYNVNDVTNQTEHYNDTYTKASSYLNSIRQGTEYKKLKGK